MKKLLLFLILGMFMISFVSAMEIDNIKNYNEDTKTMTIKNSFLGIPLGKVAEIKLNTPLNFKVDVGYQKVAEFTITSYEDYNKGLKELELFDKNDNDKKFNRNFDFKVLSYKNIKVNDYKNIPTGRSKNGSVIYERKLTGSHKEKVEVWTKLTTLDFDKDEELTIGIFTDVQVGDYVEWIPNMFGVRVEEWATWEANTILTLGLSGTNYPRFTTFNISGTWYTISGKNDGINYGYVWNGGGWTANSTIVTGLVDVGATNVPDAFYMDGSWNLLVGSTLPGVNGWTWNGASWVENSTINASISCSAGACQPDAFRKDGEWYMIQSNAAAGAVYNGYVWNGAGWTANATITAGLSTIATNKIGTAFYTWNSSAWYFVELDLAGALKGYTWDYGTNQWVSNSTILTGITNNLYTYGRFSTYQKDDKTNVIIGYQDSPYLASYDMTSIIPTSPPLITLNSPVNTFSTTNSIINFNGTVTNVDGIINVSLILDGVYNETNTSGVNNINYLFTKTINEGNHNWTYESCNINGCTNATVRTFTIDTTLPQINISAPSGTLDYNYIGNNEMLNVTSTDLNLDSCWYNYNGTNVTVEGCVSGVLNSTNFILEDGNYNLTAYSNDTTGNENSSFVNWSYTYTEINRTLNSDSFQTESESFNINVVGPTLASLFYNGTEYTSTKSGNNFNRTIQIPVANLGNNSVYWRFDGVNNSYTSYQNITETVFTLCNSTYTTPFLNISFKDESDSSIINASIPTSTFVYYLGDGTISKTYNYINNTDNFNYSFCATPNRTLNVDPIIQYKQGSLYPQRTWDPNAQQYTNTTTNQILYLLNVANGLYVTFQVINIALQPISDVVVAATRAIESVTTSVAQGTTDSAGAVTFWLNPDFEHTLTFTKTGYDVLTKILFPTQSTYTITLGGTTTTEPDQTRGVSTSVEPTIPFLTNDTSYDFNYTISSTYWNLVDFGFNLTYNNGTEINSQSSTVSSGGTLNINANTLNSSWIRMDYYYLINTTYTNYTRIWYIQSTEYTEYSISNFLKRFTTYTNAGMFGFDDFGKALISFLILIMVAGGLSYRYGIQSEVAIMGIIFGLVLVLDVGLGLIPNPQLATQSGIENIITVITGILLFGMLVKEELR